MTARASLVLVLFTLVACGKKPAESEPEPALVPVPVPVPVPTPEPSPPAAFTAGEVVTVAPPTLAPPNELKDPSTLEKAREAALRGEPALSLIHI